MPEESFSRTAIRWLFTVVFIAALGAAFYFADRGNNAAMGAFAVAGILALLAANLDQIKRFKGVGIDLETRVREASERIDHLRKLSVAIARPVLGILAGEGRVGGMGRRKYRTRDAVNKELQALGLSDEQIAKANSEWHKYMTWDHVSEIGDLAQSNLAAASDTAEVNKFAQEFEALRNYKKLQVPTPARLRDFLQERNFLVEEVEEAIKDYEHYLDHRELRRGELWLKKR